MQKQSSNKRTLGNIIIVSIITTIVLAILCFSLREKQTITGENPKKQEEYSLLACKNNFSKLSIFDSPEAKNIKNEIRITYNNDIFSNALYIFTGEYDNHNAAISAEANLHADANIFLANHGITNYDLYSPSYNILDNVYKMSFFAEKSNLNAAVAPLFMLPTDSESNEVITDRDTVKKYLTNNGFSCQIN